MPKEKETRFVFWERINRKYPGIFRVQNGYGYCLLCNCTVQARKLFSVEQHLNTNKHKIAALNFSPGTPATSHDEIKNAEYDFELSRCFLDANIPLSKIEHPSIRELLEKYTECLQPNLATLQQKTVPKLYRDRIKKMQKLVKRGEYIWISIDFMEIEQQLIGNLVFGILDPNGVGRNKFYLLNAAIINEVDDDNISSFLLDSLELLYPQGIQQDKIMVCVTAADTFIIKAMEKIKTTFPKMLHITCFAQCFHQVGDYIRKLFPNVNSLISNVNTVFLMSPYHRHLFKKNFPHIPLPPNPCITRWCSWLKAAIYYSNYYKEIQSIISELNDNDAEAIITSKNILKNEEIKTDLNNLKSKFSVLVKGTERMEKKGLQLQEIMSVLESVFNSISLIEQKEYREKLEASFQKTDGYNCLLQIYKALNEDYKPKHPFVQNLTETELTLFKYCPVTVYRVENSFHCTQLFNSQYRMLRFESLKQNLIIYCNNLDD